ncbi:hypothetical protein K1W69_12070 [Hoeflea sp. WL0058]|uniref:Short-chain dehydrogenase n=1 Tax=Flavimaribacter sediminis TaxID=2865987 RepID=A0AAE2ZJH4_9HYPH|nr:hypothetical protein [Flavimaribacter sediminis]MBW8637924.1 hypothetical protein [Flavimaribacter sediminis]
MRRLANRLAMITGAAVGVGKACAGAHAREGARAAIAGFDRARAAGAAVGIGDGALAVRAAAAFERTGGTTVLLTRPAMATAQTG